MGMNSGRLIRADGAVKDSQTIRARDVVFALKGTNTDPIVAQLLAQLAESNHVNTKSIAEMAVMLSQMANIITGFTTVAENMKRTVEQFSRREADVPDDITTQ